MSAENGSFGVRLKALREGMDLSLRDLADRSGVSAPMLSQVERGETSPTLAVAERIAFGLELSLSQLLRLDEGDGVSVVRSDERRRAGGSAALLRGAHAAAAPACVPRYRCTRSRPGAATAGPDDPPMHEAGSRETAIVERGPVRFVCGGAAHDLEDGDSVTFDADLPHHFENPGDGRGELLRRSSRPA